MPYALVNPDFSELLSPALVKKGFTPLRAPRCKTVHPALAGHLDLQFALYDTSLVFRPDIEQSFLDSLPESLQCIKGETIPKDPYPHDISYNIKATSSHYFHKTDKTDPVLQKHLEDSGRKAITVSQGYTGCTTLILQDEALISSDSGIIKKASLAGLKTLQIAAGYIALPGFSYGFIGGASGVYRDQLFFSGHLDGHPDRNKILQLAEKLFMDVTFLSTLPLFDVGTIFLFD